MVKTMIQYGIPHSSFLVPYPCPLDKITKGPPTTCIRIYKLLQNTSLNYLSSVLLTDNLETCVLFGENHYITLGVNCEAADI